MGNTNTIQKEYLDAFGIGEMPKEFILHKDVIRYSNKPPIEVVRLVTDKGNFIRNMNIKPVFIKSKL